MRTFHIGGTASQTFKQPIIKAKNDGTVRFNDLRTVQALDGSWIALNKNGSISVHNAEGRELERYNVVIGSMISKGDGTNVKKGETFVQWDPYNVPILTDKSGKIEFRDMIAGVTIKRDVDEATGLMGTVIIEHKEDLHPQIVIIGDKKEVVASYSIPAGAHVIVEEDQKIRAGALLAKTPRKVAKTKDITGGLPRVAELFEARRPKDAAEIAKIDGVVEMGGTVRGKRRLILKDPETGAEEEHLISLTKHIIAFKGDDVFGERNEMFLFRARFRVLQNKSTFAANSPAHFDHAVDFRDLGRVFGTAGFEQFGNPRQPAGDVFGLGDFSRRLSQQCARSNFLVFFDNDVRACWN